MLKGERVILRTVEREDLKRLHELEQNVGLVLLGDGQWQPVSLVGTLLGWAFRIQNYRRIWLETLAVNERAIRAYHAIGFVEEGRLRNHAFFDGRYVDVLQMGLLRAEWETRHR